MLTPTVVRNTQFTMTRHRPGYQPRAVDGFLDRIGTGLDRLIRENDEIRARFTAIRRTGTGPQAPAPSIPSSVTPLNPGPMTPADVRKAQFALTLPGYEPMEVDDFLDRLEEELARLIGENDAIRAQFAGAQFARPQYGGNSPRRPVASGVVASPGPAKAGRSEFRGMLVLALFFAAAAIAFGYFAAGSYSAFQRSSYTQANGIPDSAVVTGEHVGTGKAAQTQVMVRLQTPVGGRDASVVNISGAHPYQTGDRISILVDPRDPSYAELPGQPDEVPLETLVLTAIGGSLMIVAAAGSLIVALRARPSRRRGQSRR